MNRTLTISGPERWARAAALLAFTLVLGACGADASDQPPVIFAQNGGTPAVPVVQGLGPDPVEPAIADTIDLRQIGYSLGADEAPVQVYEFSDFGCPFCAMFARGTFPALHDEFVTSGKVRWTYIPFVMGMFPNGAESTLAAECAAEQDAFWPMHDRLYAAPNDWKGTRNPASLFADYAEELDLEVDEFRTCYRQKSVSDRITLHNRAADALRVRATPSFFINGRLVEGSIPQEQFRQLLNTLAGAG